MNDFLGSVCLLVGIVGVVALVIYIFNARERIERAYKEALEQLRQDPHDPDLRQKVLECGREWAKINKKFDEVKLMNDINAACARAGSEVSIKGNQRADSKPSIEERLERLDDLRAKGLISDGEHMARRQAILDEL